MNSKSRWSESKERRKTYRLKFTISKKILRRKSNSWRLLFPRNRLKFKGFRNKKVEPPSMISQERVVKCSTLFLIHPCYKEDCLIQAYKDLTPWPNPFLNHLKVYMQLSFSEKPPSDSKKKMNSYTFPRKVFKLM